MTEITYREMTIADLDAVVTVENQSFVSPWSRQAFCDELYNQLAHYLLAVMEETVIGYVGMWLIIDEAHITNVAVLPSYRKLGIGKCMMQKALDVAKERGAVSMTLEVRPSNAPALALYKNLGFEHAGVRKNYYEDTQEDAIIMWLREIQ
ncbi:MAG: ribosomal-protein-alanine acetyltransferase [Firmicutes bacterium]|nr:ribosomal-protein-alanine acetyltransferase [Bacillota bacterium]